MPTAARPFRRRDPKVPAPDRDPVSGHVTGGDLWAKFYTNPGIPNDLLDGIAATARRLVDQLAELRQMVGIETAKGKKRSADFRPLLDSDLPVLDREGLLRWMLGPLTEKEVRLRYTTPYDPVMERELARIAHISDRTARALAANELWERWRDAQVVAKTFRRGTVSKVAYQFGKKIEKLRGGGGRRTRLRVTVIDRSNDPTTLHGTGPVSGDRPT